MNTCEFYQYHYWQFCYKIARSAGNKKSSIIRLRLIVTLTHHFLNMVLIIPNACSFWLAFLHTLCIWVSNLRALSKLTPRSLTCSLGVISCPLMLKHSLFFLLSPKNIIGNCGGLALMPLAVSHSNTSCRSLTNLIITETIFELHEYIVVSSSELHISYSRSLQNRSFTKTLKSKGTKTEPCGTPIEVHFGEL